jgi:hypothetical protein
MALLAAMVLAAVAACALIVFGSTGGRRWLRQLISGERR